jgi:phosphoribosylformylglycinamidine synthase subunit PurL
MKNHASGITNVGVALAADGNGRYGRISPYWQGANAAIEAMRNVAAVGATPRALTDCLNYGNPEIPEHLWALEEGVRGIADAARGVAIGGESVPVISGNVSLYNSRPDGSAIDPTAIVCAIGMLPDAHKAIGMHLHSCDCTLYHVGAIRDACGGSLYYAVLEDLTASPRDAFLGANVPQPDFAEEGSAMTFVASTIQSGLIQSCHDVGDGGLLLTLFEMTLPLRRRSGGLGVDVALDALPGDLRTDVLLFSESGGFVVAVPRGRTEAFEQAARAHAVRVSPLGTTMDVPSLRIARSGSLVLEEDLTDLRRIWESALETSWKRETQ